VLKFRCTSIEKGCKKMPVLSAQKILESLARARAIGHVEESVTIAGCAITLQSLRPEEYEVIHAESNEKQDLAYLNAYRMEHLCRSIVVLNDLDFHDVTGVEIEVEEPDERTGAMTKKNVVIEKNDFVRDHILSTWSREAVDVCFQKFNDVIAMAERVSSDGVKFETADETSEEKYRRLLSEMKDIEGTIPAELAARLLDDAGLSKKVTSIDMEAAEQRLGKLAAEAAQRDADEPAEAASTAPRRPAYEQPPVQPAAPSITVPNGLADQIRQKVQASPEGSQIRAASPEQLAKMRTPLNQGPTPPMMEPQQHVGQVPQVARSNQGPPPVYHRSQQIAMEEGIDMPAVAGGTEILTLEHQPKLDPKGAMSIIDRPPQGGTNPRFRPPPRMGG